MQQSPLSNSAFLSPSHIPRRPSFMNNAACPRVSTNPQPSSQHLSKPHPRSISANLKPSQVVEGVVSHITSFGAFVDLGNAKSGLVHISEIADAFIQDIHQHVSVGQRVKVKVLSVNTKNNRIALSIKQAIPAASGYDRIVELGGDWGHPWGDDPQTKFMDLGPRPEPQPHHWQPDTSLFRKWDTDEQE